MKKKIAKLEPIAKLIDRTAAPLLSNMTARLESWGLGYDPPLAEKYLVPEAYLASRKALKAEIDQRPPNLANLQTAVTKAQAAYDAAVAMTPKARAAAAAADVKTAKDKEKKNKAERATWRRTLRALEEKYAAAVDAVDRADGDRNALAAADRLIKMIKGGIDSNVFGSVKTGCEDLEGRLKLLLSNPRGEANSRRSELPDVIKELRSATETAVKDITAVTDAIQQHETTTDAELDAKMLGLLLLSDYVKMIDIDVDAFEEATQPINDTKTQDEDARRAAREAGLRLLRAARKRLQTQPITAEFLQSPFRTERASLAQMFGAMDKYEYTLMTCI